MISINSIENLNEFIINTSEVNNQIIMLYFGANWCNPCKKLKERLDNDETKQELPNLVVAYINIDNELNKELIEIYDVQMLPTCIFIKLIDNEIIDIIDRIDGHDWTKLVMIYQQINIEN
jgi:thiol-disulfide isomerase/thioredoxin